jgi:hypothetical protein
MNVSHRDLIAGAIASAASPPRRPVLKTVAFDYAGKLPVPDLQFLARFDVVVTGGVLAVDQLQVLRSGRARLVLYQWSSAFYPGQGDPAQNEWQGTVQKNAGAWLLSSKPTTGGAATAGVGALWYDFGNPDLASAFAEHLHKVVAGNGYKGVFLDTLGRPSLPETILREYNKRHPGLEYDRAQAGLITKLRAVLGPDGIIFTNQAYRRAEIFLPNVDFDLIENSATTVGPNGEIRLRPWFDAKAPWESVEVPITNLVIPAAKAFPKTRFVQLNYAAGTDETCRRATRYSFACAKLWDHGSFVAPPHIQNVIRDNIYFARLGEPSGATYEEDRDAGVAWRRFRNGVVAVNSSNVSYKIRSLGLTLSNPPNGYIFLGQH